MTRLFGFVGPFSGPASWESLLQFGNECSGYDGIPGVQTEQTRSSASWGPLAAASQDVRLVMQGGPFWLARGKVLNQAPSKPQDVLAEYERAGIEFLRHLKGRFALALYDRKAARAVLAIDPMGSERLAYAQAGGGVVYSTSAEAVARFPAIRATLNRQALFDYMLLHIVPAPVTVYAGVQKLRAGTAAIVERGGLRVERYWKPEFAAAHEQTFEALKDELHLALRHGVNSCSPDDASGAFLSGGLDSSTVTGMLSASTGRRPQTFSMSFGVDDYNEIEYARIAAQRFDAVSHEYEVTPADVVDAFPRIASAFDEPFGNSSAVPTYVCAKLASSHGISHLLAGDGGDELFAGNERYSKQRVFEAYQSIPGLLRQSLVEPIALGISADTRIIPARKLRSYVEQARIPMPQRLEFWNFMFRTDLDAMLEPDFRNSIDTDAALRGMVEVYSDAPGASFLDRMLRFDWQYTLADNDLRKVSQSCELAGLRVSYPMLHPDLIDLSIRIPSQMKMPGGKLRHFYKRAMRGFLPDEILNKEKHGFGLPFAVWIKTHPPFAELIYAMLSDLKARRIVRPAFLDKLIADQRTGHANYFGYAIWDLAMLEAWLQAHPGL